MLIKNSVIIFISVCLLVFSMSCKHKQTVNAYPQFFKENKLIDSLNIPFFDVSYSEAIQDTLHGYDFTFMSRLSVFGKYDDSDFRPLIDFSGFLYINKDSIFLNNKLNKKFLFLLLRDTVGLIKTLDYNTNCIIDDDNLRYCNSSKYSLFVDTVYWSEEVKDTIYSNRFKGFGSQINYTPYWDDLVIKVSKKYGIIGTKILTNEAPPSTVNPTYVNGQYCLYSSGW